MEIFFKNTCRFKSRIERNTDVENEPILLDEYFKVNVKIDEYLLPVNSERYFN